MDLIFVLDVSNSMSASISLSPTDPIRSKFEVAVDLIVKTVNSLKSNDRAGLVTFCRTSQ